MNRTEKYAEALRQLDRMRDDGTIDQASYEVRRQALLAESSKVPRSLLSKILIFAAIIVVIFVLLSWCSNVARMAGS